MEIDFYCVRDRNSIVLVLVIEDHLILVSGHRNLLGLSIGIEIDLILALRSKFISFLCELPKPAWFLCGGRNDLFVLARPTMTFRAWLEVECLFCVRPK